MRRIDFIPSTQTAIRIGPIDPVLPGPMDLFLEMDGELIVSARVRTGYLHRGIEKVIQEGPWSAAPVAAGRLEGESPFFSEWVFCQAVESIMRLDLPERAQVIRITLAEITRILSHLGFLRRMAELLEITPLYHYCSRDREMIMDLLELVSGSRWGMNYCVVGGVREDVTDGFQDRVLDAVGEIRYRLKEYNDLFVFHRAATARLQETGWISKQQIYRFGITGPTARASGEAYDVRKEKGQQYRSLDFEIPLGSGRELNRGDVHDRVLIRLREVAVSLDILNQVCGSMPKGNWKAGEVGSPRQPLVAVAGEGFASVESPRGVLGCHVVSDGGKTPVRVHFITPSRNALSVVPLMLAGERLEDVGLLLASLDLSIGEADA